jgi:hypothetical protein
MPRVGTKQELLERIAWLENEVAMLRMQLLRHVRRASESDDEEEEDARRMEQEDWPRCGCQYCFCCTRTEYGEPCDNCVAHAHQG